MSNTREQVEALIAKAAKAEHADDAMRFSQAACNAANAMCSLETAKNLKK
jgi:hypothetical protein